MNSVLNSCPASLQLRVASAVKILKEAIEAIRQVYTLPMNTLSPRPALMLVGAISSSVYLLEHAIWSHTISENTEDLDVDVFNRWVFEGGMEATIQLVKRVQYGTEERVKFNAALVFGSKTISKL